MAAGELRERVMFQSFTKETGDYGNRKKEWEDYAEVSAKVEMLGGSESEEHRQQVAEKKVRITIRYSRKMSQLTTAMRAVWCSRVLNIGSVTWDEKRQYISVDAMQSKGGA